MTWPVVGCGPPHPPVDGGEALDRLAALPYAGDDQAAVDLAARALHDRPLLEIATVLRRYSPHGTWLLLCALYAADMTAREAA